MLYRNITTQDLRGSTLADFLVNIEADFEVLDDHETIYSELSFPVAELACELARWLSLGKSKASDFYFSSLSFEDPGSVVILERPEGWTVGSLLTPQASSAPIPWSELTSRIDDFITSVQRDIAELGINPDFIFTRQPR